MKNFDKTKPVLVTGATGYVASRLVEHLLTEGLTVHAAVRDPDNIQKIQPLRRLAEKVPGQIKLFKTDLLKPGSYRDAMDGCEVVFHTASPFVTQVKDAQRDLVDPALLGTRNVLGTANDVASVERVVLTSSVVAMYGDNKDIQNMPNQTLTEKEWNTTSSLDHNPYYYSKTVAEKEAWAIHKTQERWDLVVINPALVIGPGIDPNSTSESFTIMRQLGNGSMAMGVPDFSIGVVDVRDVAEAHYQAAVRPHAQGRHIVSAASTSMIELAGILQQHFGDAYPFPRRTLPKFVAWLGAPSAGLSRTFVSRNVGFPFRADNSRSRNELGITYRPVETSVVEFFTQLVSSGQLNKSDRHRTNQRS